MSPRAIGILSFNKCCNLQIRLTVYVFLKARRTVASAMHNAMHMVVSNVADISLAASIHSYIHAGMLWPSADALTWLDSFPVRKEARVPAAHHNVPVVEEDGVVRVRALLGEQLADLEDRRDLRVLRVEDRDGAVQGGDKPVVLLVAVHVAGQLSRGLEVAAGADVNGADVLPVQGDGLDAVVGPV